MKVTFEQVENWIGSDNVKREAISIIVEVANGDYKPELLKEEVSEYFEGKEI